jgi:internalin A
MLRKNPQLTQINVRGRRFSANGLKAMENAQSLIALDLQNAEGIHDDDLAAISRLKLRRIDLSNTKIGSRGMSYLAPISTLSEVMVGATNVSDEGLMSLAKLPRLTNLNLNHTKVTDDGVAHLCRLRNLRILSLDDTKVNTSLTSLNGLPIEKLFLKRTQIDDNTLKQLVLLKLSYLHLDSTNISDKGLTSLKRRMPQLRKLDIHNCPKITAQCLNNLKETMPQCEINSYTEDRSNKLQKALDMVGS